MNNITGFPGKYKIGVLAGGDSSEREISLKSGCAVFNAFKSLGFNVVTLDVNEKNIRSLLDTSGIDVAFIALHGKFGEDGTAQRILAEKGIPYTGSDPMSSRLAMDKLESKKMFIEYGLKVPEYVMVSGTELPRGIDVGFPCVVKPRYEGSSMGLSVVRSVQYLEEAVLRASEYGNDVMIERFIPGKELTVGILEGRALPVVEIRVPGGIYNYDAKYQSAGTKYIVPAELSGAMREEAQDAGLKAHRALGCGFFSRVDLRVTDEGDVYVLEVNTVPGLTERSLLPMAAGAAGMDFAGLCVNMLCGAFPENVRG
ncbi:MAG: D-alanine--D-alanine ligase [Candidatus Omnitrophota bacterium]